jgi:hypothetical protein
MKKYKIYVYILKHIFIGLEKNIKVWLHLLKGGINHEEVVEEKKNKKVRRVENICKKIKFRLSEISKEKSIISKKQINMNF